MRASDASEQNFDFVKKKLLKLQKQKGKALF